MKVGQLNFNKSDDLIGKKRSNPRQKTVQELDFGVIAKVIRPEKRRLTQKEKLLIKKPHH
jgi:hypothetical protein